MATTYDEPLQRNEYDSTPHVSTQHLDDFDEYFIPFENIHHATIHDSGIAAGLNVTAIKPATMPWELRISPGVFIDGLGQMGILATNGKALLTDTYDEFDDGDYAGVVSNLFERVVA